MARSMLPYSAQLRSELARNAALCRWRNGAAGAGGRQTAAR